MIEVAAFGGLPHRELRIASELVPEANEPVVAQKAPRIILERAQVKGVIAIRAALVSESRVIEFCSAVLLTEEKPDRVLGIARAAAEPAANAQTGIDVKSFRAIGVNYLDRG